MFAAFVDFALPRRFRFGTCSKTFETGCPPPNAGSWAELKRGDYSDTTMKADSPSQQITNFSILVGAILVAFLCSILLISSALFVSGIVISRFHVPLAGLMAAGFGWWAATVYFPAHRGRAFGL